MRESVTQFQAISHFSIWRREARSNGRRVLRKWNIRWSIWIAFGGLKWNSLLNRFQMQKTKSHNQADTLKECKQHKYVYDYNMKHGNGDLWKSLKRKIKPPFTQFERIVCCALFHFAFCVNLAQRTTEQESFIYTDSLMMNELNFFFTFFFLSESFDVQISH